jgi:hypothetical protein
LPARRPSKPWRKSLKNFQASDLIRPLFPGLGTFPAKSSTAGKTTRSGFQPSLRDGQFLVANLWKQPEQRNNKEGANWVTGRQERKVSIPDFLI